MIEISVIIATRNRADALEKISLPSLAKQDFKDFEVIIWDASDDDKPKIVVENFIQSHPDMIVRYFKAPRVGSASQRNDAVKVAREDIIFFIDDDSEVSPNGLRGVFETLQNGKYQGCELPIRKIGIQERRAKINFYLYSIVSIIFFLNGGATKRHFKLSGYGTHENEFLQKIFKRYKEDPEWLMGCSMAYKRDVFKINSFDERLQKFGGYALGEDSMFSYSLYLSGCRFTYFYDAYIIHHHYESGRVAPVYMYASRIYNYHIIWRTLIFPRHKLSLIIHWWAIFGYLIVSLAESLSKKTFIPLKGWWIGIKAIFD